MTRVVSVQRRLTVARASNGSFLTGADFWLPTPSCGSSACSKVTTWDPSSSSTAQNSSQVFAIAYGTGAVTGTMAGDTVSLAGFTIYSQSFALANQVASDTISAPASGIMGLGFQQ